MSQQNYKARVAAIESQIKKSKLDSFFVTDETNVSYLSGFEGGDSMLLVSPKKRYLLTDSRYYEDAADAVRDFEIVLVERSIFETLNGISRSLHLKKMGFESMNIPFEAARNLKKNLKGLELFPARKMVENLRAVKDQDEIRLIRESIRLTKKVFEKTVKALDPNKTEKELGQEIETEFIRNGARSSFEPIIARGANSSKPHARPENVRIGKSGHAMIDIGCVLNGYCSDMTRIVFLGKVKNAVKKIYGIVHTAQAKAIAAVSPGAKISDVDNRGRDFIKNEGFGKYFAHALGHGVGRKTHEEPAVSYKNEDILKPGMVFTVEPAIYIPKLGGIRIEDMVLVTEDGCEVLTRF